MDKHINRFVQRHSLSVGHGQEPEAHADVEPLAHPDPVEGLRVFLCARSLISLRLAHSCKFNICSLFSSKYKDYKKNKQKKKLARL